MILATAEHHRIVSTTLTTFVSLLRFTTVVGVFTKLVKVPYTTALTRVLGFPGGELKQTLIPIAFSVVLVVLLLQGLTVGPLIRKTGMANAGA
jgi:NhaP-type Na+/H+ and K+/H+ antiporter